MATIKAIADILTENKVTEEQVLAVTIENKGATVKSATEAGKEYRVEYNKVFGKLTCTCAAGINGTPCWHKRAALAKLAINRLNARAIVDDCMNDASIPQTVEEAERAQAAPVVEVLTPEEAMYRELRNQGTDSGTAYRVAFAQPKRGPKAPDSDRTFSLFK